MRRALCVFLALAALSLSLSPSLAAQARARSDDEAALRAKLAQAQARLDRLIELRIRLDLGVAPRASEIAALFGLPGHRDLNEATAALAAEEQRLTALRQRLSDLSRGITATAPEGGAEGSEGAPSQVAPRVAAPAAMRPIESAEPESRPHEETAESTQHTRPAREGESRPATRPSGRQPVQLDPGQLPLQAMLTLLEGGRFKEATAALEKLQSTQPGMTEFVAGLCAERAGDLDAAERNFEASADKIRKDRTASVLLKSLEESVQLALDHMKWKRERQKWKPPFVRESAAGK